MNSQEYWLIPMKRWLSSDKAEKLLTGTLNLSKQTNKILLPIFELLELHHEKTNNLHMSKQRRRSASR